jgi:hypothetical protein
MLKKHKKEAKNNEKVSYIINVLKYFIFLFYFRKMNKNFEQILESLEVNEKIKNINI